MKKIVVSLFLMVAMLSFSAKKSSAENEIRASFDRFMQDLTKRQQEVSDFYKWEINCFFCKKN